MGLLGRAVRGAVRGSARATGRALSRHVVPDTLIPSWKTQRAASSVGRLISSPFKKKKKAKPTRPTSYRSPALAGVRPAASPAGTARPTAKGSKSPVRSVRPLTQKHDRNAWAQGRALSVPREFAPQRQAPVAQPRPRSRFRQQLHDFRNEPRLVAQMYADELRHSARQAWDSRWKKRAENPY